LLPDWPSFRWREADITAPLAAVRHRQGRLIGRMESLSFELRSEAILVTLTDDADHNPASIEAYCLQRLAPF